MTDTVLLSHHAGTAYVTLNRPENHNAFDAGLITSLDAVLAEVEALKPRLMILTGSGATFSAGADLNWMRDMAKADWHSNYEDAMALARCLRRLNNLPLPTIARVNGSAYGGGVGLLSCCDIAVAADTAKFTLSEVKLGLVPAVISPYVISAIGRRQARRYFLSAEIIEAPRALQIGLIHECVAIMDLDQQIERMAHWLGKSAPNAAKEAKQLIHGFTPAETELQMDNQDKANAALIARLRVGDEGQEGLNAFLGKRPAHWIGS